MKWSVLESLWSVRFLFAFMKKKCIKMDQNKSTNDILQCYKRYGKIQFFFNFFFNSSKDTEKCFLQINVLE